MQLWRTLAVVIGALLFQVAVGQLLQMGGLHWRLPFDLFLILTVFYAGTLSQFWGTVLGALLGLLSDALAPQQILGRQSFALALTGYAAGAFNALFVITAGVMKLVAVLVATFLSKGVVYGLDVLIEGSGTFRTAEVTREAIGNAIVAPLVMVLLGRWHHLAETGSQRVDRRLADRLS